MKLITKTAEVLRRVPERWNEQYGPDYNCYEGEERRETYRKLCALIASGEYTAHQINEIIGNNSWTKLECYECGRDVESIVHLGEEPDYESRTFYLCLNCWKKAGVFFRHLKG